MKEQEIANLQSQLQLAKEALTKINNWNQHTTRFAADYGSNGVRDHYRNIAKVALEKLNSPVFSYTVSRFTEDDIKDMVIKLLNKEYSLEDAIDQVQKAKSIEVRDDIISIEYDNGVKESFKIFLEPIARPIFK